MQHDAIIVTISEQFLKEYSIEKLHQDIENLNTVDNSCWYFKIKNLPKVQTQYCYWIVGNKIRYRLEVLEFRRNESYSFERPDNQYRSFRNSNWIILQGPVTEAPYDMEMRGFQGFRYTELIF